MAGDDGAGPALSFHFLACTRFIQLASEGAREGRIRYRGRRAPPEVAVLCRRCGTRWCRYHRECVARLRPRDRAQLHAPPAHPFRRGHPPRSVHEGGDIRAARHAPECTVALNRTTRCTTSDE